jgi:LysM repeat protein
MSLKRMAALLLLLVLPLLSGCFQQAGEAFKPADSSQATPPQNSNPGEASLTSFPATETLPLVITVVEPTIPAVDLATNPPQQDTAIPLPTDEGGSAAITPTTDQGFSTPNIPLGPLPTDTPNLSITMEAPSATPSGLITPTALGESGSSSASSADGACTHTVQRGDTLFRIANKYNITLAQLRQANPQLTSDIIQPGQVLQLPNCNGQANIVPTTEPGDNATSAPVPAGGQLYTVKRGDTVYTIARRFGVKMQDIIDANKLNNPDNLKVGQQLIIPSSGS